MAVRLRINTLTPTTYRFADRSADYGGYLWLGRIQNAPQLEELAAAPGTEFQVKRINVSLGNSDGIIPVTENLWGGVATLEIDNGTTTRTWSGIVKAYDHDGAGNLAIGVTEDPQHELSRMIPDEVVRLSTWSEAGADAVNTPVPTVFGGSAADPVRVPGILVDRTTFTFLLCVGEIRQVVKVFKDRVEVTEGFTAYVGAADQETFPGFTIVIFAADPRDDSGRWPEIHADVVGLKLGDHTEEECRNPARCLKYLFETAASGVNGWGLGVNALKIDGDSFDQAITDCQEIGFKLDGALSAQMTSRQWISQMTLAMRGRLAFNSGKYAIRVDKAYVPPEEPEEPVAGYLTVPEGDDVIVTRVEIGEHTYDVFVFLASSSAHAEGDIEDADILLIGGGGGGGGCPPWNGGGGGGAGGVLRKTGVKIASGDYDAVIGSGGLGATTAANGGTGGASSFGEFECGGGGGGAMYGGSPDTPPSAGGAGKTVGGCGGGAARDSLQYGGAVGSQAGDGIETFNNAGGNGGLYSAWRSGGGGGGAGSAGIAGGYDQYGISAPTSQGGAGISSDITGETLWYAGGGGGSFYQGAALGGSGVGGAGGLFNQTGSSATENRGSGGGGGTRGGNGSKGILIIRYKVTP
jgi:hypothetical protein